MDERDRKEAALAHVFDVGRSLPPLSGSTKYVPGTGDVLSKVVIIGEAPGRDEDEQGEPFVGLAGRLLNSALAELGITREMVYITNVVKYRPPKNNFKEVTHLIDHVAVLEKEIEVIDPVAVLLLGRNALNSVTSKTLLSTSLGQELIIPYWRAYTTVAHHPSYVLYGGMKREDWFKEIESFFERALLTFLDEPTK